jgi:hypothetical protein
MLTITDIANHFIGRTLDIRVDHNGRWVDQKCTIDVITTVADCIVEYSNSNQTNDFTVSDIWQSDYAINLIPNIFNKPHPLNDGAKNEYDKFFGQPIKLLAYSGVLTEVRQGRGYQYSINNRHLLEHIAVRERNTIDFLNIYFNKVLSDSNWIAPFNNFLNHPTDQNYALLRDSFFDNTQQYTPINGDLECGRIFTKVLNLLAFVNRTNGSERGRMSPHPITLDKLMYNRDNFRDIYNNKPRHMTRDEFERIHNLRPNGNFSTYQSTKAKKYLRRFNDQYFEKSSEVHREDWEISDATHAHHIFMQSQYREIAHYYENLIMLTPSQHMNYAHPNNNTHRVDRAYQHICILAKIATIEQNLMKANQPDIYEFSKMLYVLDVGLDTDEFTQIADGDYQHLIHSVNMAYSDI